MGLYDRDYTRRETVGFGGSNPLGESMVLTIIAINVAVFLADLFFGGRNHWIANSLAASGDSLAKPWLWWQLITSGFVHNPQDIWHLVGNMAGLWFLGRSVEAWLGKWEFLRFYLFAILCGSVIHTARVCLLVDPQWWSSVTLVGASGAVTAVVMLFIFKFPYAQLNLFFVWPMPAWIVGVIVVGQDLVRSGNPFSNPFGDTQAATQVAYDVHLAGAAFAFLYFYFGLNFGRMIPSRWARALQEVKLPKRSPKLRVHKPVDDDIEDEQYRDLDEEADRVLAKVGAHGQDSLTPAERRVLEAYSRRMQQKHR